MHNTLKKVTKQMAPVTASNGLLAGRGYLLDAVLSDEMSCHLCICMR
jgi:hypothetical protein